MSAKDQFRAFLSAELSGEGAPNQTLLAELAGVQYKHLNAFLNGRQGVGEEARERVAEALNRRYSECIEIGRLLLGEEQQEESKQEILDSQQDLRQAIDRTYSYFDAALQYFAAKGGRGFQIALAHHIGLSLGFINQVLNTDNDTRAGFEAQVKIAALLKFEYEDFLRFGRDLTEDRQT